VAGIYAVTMPLSAAVVVGYFLLPDTLILHKTKVPADTIEARWQVIDRATATAQ
jgi:hypothetical protein